jgi:hypothetical protein
MSVSFLFVLLLQTKDTRANALVSRRQRGGAYVGLGLPTITALASGLVISEAAYASRICSTS